MNLMNTFYNAKNISELTDYTFKVKGGKHIDKSGKLTPIGYMFRNFN